MSAAPVTLATGTAAPSQTPAALSLTAVELGTAITVFGALATGSGDLLLWRWEPKGNADGAGAWYPYGAAFAVDSGANSGKYLQRYAVDKDAAGYYYLQLPIGSTSGHARVRGAKL